MDFLKCYAELQTTKNATYDYWRRQIFRNEYENTIMYLKVRKKNNQFVYFQVIHVVNLMMQKNINKIMCKFYGQNWN